MASRAALTIFPGDAPCAITRSGLAAFSAAPAIALKPEGRAHPAPVSAASFINVLLSTVHLTFPLASDARMPQKQRAEKITNAVFMLVRNRG
jgi:hypothetical protein